ncbi:MAG: hypothetical protein EGR08_00850 [Prevotella sp.]|nr:hypothetical protein [Prevotella sp.]
MKKLLYFLLAVTTLTACSNDDNNEPQLKKGMTLKAYVEDLGTRATMTDVEGKWKFSFDNNDNVNVSNNKITTYYSFKNNGTDFVSTDAMATSEAADWYAYFPGNEVDLTNQTGSFDGVANKYAVAGKTTVSTTGESGLTISLSAKVAVLRVVEVDKTGTLDINVKTADGKWVKGLTANKNAADFTISTSDTKTTLLSKSSTAAEISYVVVPAGQKIAIYNGSLLLNTTKDAGLTAGKYYTITSGPTKGTATALINGEKKSVNWVQLWAGGPRFATEDVTEEMTWFEATKTGSDFVWGENWRIATADEVTEEGGLLYDWDNMTTKPGSPTVAVQESNGESIVKITGVQLCYTKNELTLYNRIDKYGYGHFDFWTSTEGADANKGTKFAITEHKGIIGGFGLDKLQWKTNKLLVRPILAKSPW